MNRDPWQDIACIFYRYGVITFFVLLCLKICVKILT